VFHAALQSGALFGNGETRCCLLHSTNSDLSSAVRARSCTVLPTHLSTSERNQNLLVGDMHPRFEHTHTHTHTHTRKVTRPTRTVFPVYMRVTRRRDDDGDAGCGSCRQTRVCPTEREGSRQARSPSEQHQRVRCCLRPAWWRPCTR
jgi:hypothetical protein